MDGPTAGHQEQDLAGLRSQQAPGQVVISSGAFPLVAGGGKGWCEQTRLEAVVTGWGLDFTLICSQVASRGEAVFQQSPRPASLPPPCLPAPAPRGTRVQLGEHSGAGAFHHTPRPAESAEPLLKCPDSLCRVPQSRCQPGSYDIRS